MKYNRYNKETKIYRKFKDISKEEIIILGIILFICIIICSPLLQMHIASDTYNLMDLGYFEYPKQFFLKDARIISSLVLYIGGILNLPYEVFIVSMEVLAVIISALSIYFIYKTVKERTNISSIWKKALIIMSGFILVFNCMSLEYLLYAECSVMCLGLLLSILAARIFSGETNHKYIKSLALIILATFCYQGVVNIFLPLTTLFIFISKNEMKIKETIKEYIKQILMACSIIVVSYVTNIIGIYVINMMLDSEQTRMGSGILNNLRNFANILSSVIKSTLIYNYNLWPKGVTLIFIAISTIILLFQKDSTKLLIEYILIIIFALGICTVQLFFMKRPSMECRMAMSIGAIIGMSLIFLTSIETNNRITENIVSVVITAFFLFNLINTIQIYTVHIVTNKIDANMGIAIKYKIEEYEKQTGNTVSKVAYWRDKNHRDFHYGWEKKYSSFAQRAFDNYYCIIEALNYYCNKKFISVPMDEEIYIKYFEGKDWEAYSDEQLIFDGDIMYLCTY